MIIFAKIFWHHIDYIKGHYRRQLVIVRLNAATSVFTNFDNLNYGVASLFT